MFLFVITTMNTVVVLCQRRNNEYFEVRCRGVFSVFWLRMSGDPRGGRAGLPGARLGPGHGLQLRQPRERGVLRRHADSLPGTSWAMKYLIFYHIYPINWFYSSQVFHVCLHSGSSYFGLIKYSFVCPNGTMFQQKYFTCDWWYNVDCGASQDYYDLNNNLFKEQQQNVAKIQVKYRLYLMSWYKFRN